MSCADGFPGWLHPDGSACLLEVSVVPNARRTAVDGEHGGALRVRLGAPAVDGKANAALTDYLAQCCDVPRRAVKIKTGLTARRKRVQIDAPAGAVWLRLSALLPQSV
ncbi:MAG: DUF167 domain-containing protein [Thiomonas sp.]|uniref:DUF167 domain-containing protein n=1 Tax=Thiomonas sp. TaxID=2047785 RepID=UPI002A36F97A|nr:DUF167 domain-containing protein [Thiomonas sp.]MDY0330541.1 DUF167 domain-containing protein [Thiomonas sp.]